MHGWKKWIYSIGLIFILSLVHVQVNAQCSICTRTAEQLGEKPAKGLNAGILYLAFAPLAIVGFLGYRYIKSQR